MGVLIVMLAAAFPLTENEADVALFSTMSAPGFFATAKALAIALLRSEWVVDAWDL